jgi:hypothetical protein
VLLPSLVALRFWYVFHLRIDQDEWQHLHTIWSAVAGRLQYRDAFDNHMPLFHLLFRPLVQWVGERADIVTVMRLFMVPIFFASLGLTYLITRRLYDANKAAWTTVCVGLCPVFLFTGTEFRPDQLWCLLWLSAIALMVFARPSMPLAFAVGILLGMAVAVSLKSVLLLGGLAGGLIAVAALSGDRPKWKQMVGYSAAGLLGLAVAPALVAAWFASKQALPSFWEGVAGYNIRFAEDATPLKYVRTLWFVPALMLLWQVLRRIDSNSSCPPGIHLRRAFLVAVGGCYLALLLCFWPILSNEDYLPVIPLLMPALVAFLQAQRKPTRLRFLNPLPLFALAELAVALIARPPVWHSCMPECALLKQVLQVTDDADFVMDPTGQSVFRPRPYYYIMETIAKNALQKGRLPDVIAHDMVLHRTCVAVDGHEYPPATRQFLAENYLSIGDLLIAGRMWRFDEPQSGVSVHFDVAVPASYVLICPHGEIDGAPPRPSAMLDGEPYEGMRFLSAGPHVLTWEGRHPVVALEWAKAYERGLRPFIMDP